MAQIRSSFRVTWHLTKWQAKDASCERPGHASLGLCSYQGWWLCACQCGVAAQHNPASSWAAARVLNRSKTESCLSQCGNRLIVASLHIHASDKLLQLQLYIAQQTCPSVLTTSVAFPIHVCNLFVIEPRWHTLCKCLALLVTVKLLLYCLGVRNFEYDGDCYNTSVLLQVSVQNATNVRECLITARPLLQVSSWTACKCWSDMDESTWAMALLTFQAAASVKPANP